jgi:hypothetical protein
MQYGYSACFPSSNAIREKVISRRPRILGNQNVDPIYKSRPEIADDLF